MAAGKSKQNQFVALSGGLATKADGRPQEKNGHTAAVKNSNILEE
jgi:hypothetical protein